MPFRPDARIGAQGCGEVVDVGVGSFVDGSIVAGGRHLRCHLVPEVMLAEGWEAAGFIGIGVGIVRDVVFQVNKDHHDAM